MAVIGTREANMTGGRAIPYLSWDGRIRRGIRSSSAGRRLLWLAALVGVTGCDSGSFVPPRPAELAGGTPAATVPGGANPPSASTGPASGLPASVRAIELISAPCSPGDAENLRARARIVAGLEKVRIQVAVAGEKGSTEPQAALVRTAATRKPPVLIVEPDDPADSALATAIDEARGQGIPVILMGRPLTTQSKGTAGGEPSKDEPGARSAGSGRLIAVVPQPFPGSARQLVEALLNNAENIGSSADSGAVLLINTRSDRLSDARIEALRSALGTANVRPVKELSFDGEIKSASQSLIEFMKANPKIGMVLSSDHNGLTASFQAMNELGESRPYVVAGYTSDESSGTMTRSGEFAAAAVYSADRLLRKSIMTAAAVMRGENVPDRVELMVPVNQSPATSGAPKTYRMMGSPPAERKAAGDPASPAAPREPAKSR